MVLEQTLARLDEITGSHNKNLSSKNPEVLAKTIDSLKEFFTPLSKEQRVEIFYNALKHHEGHKEYRGYDVFSGYVGAQVFEPLKAIIKNGDLKLWQAATGGLTTEEKMRVLGAHYNNSGDSLWHVLAKAENPELFKYSLRNLTVGEKITAFSNYNFQHDDECTQNRNEVGNTVWHVVVKNKNPEFQKIAFKGLSPEEKLSVLRLERKYSQLGERVGSVVVQENKTLVFAGLTRIQRMLTKSSKENSLSKVKEDGSTVRISFSNNGSRILEHHSPGNKDELEDRTVQYLKRENGTRKYTGPEGTMEWSKVIRQHEDGSAIYEREEPFRR